MLTVRSYEDPAFCRVLWETIWPQDFLFDLWPVRECFAAGYRRRQVFLAAEENGRPVGLLALSRIREQGCFMHYPGETWKGKTWLEQNRIPATRVEITQELLAAVPGEVKLRYLRREALPLNLGPVAVDEPGYLFHPARFSFSFQNYLASFPAKSRKKILREIERLERHGVAVRYGNIADAGWVFRTNLETFGVDSYFYDPRFLDSMERLVSWLHNRKMLEVTTILLGGVVAAVDIGAVWRGIYTVLAGATNPLFPGVAKMINFYHLQRACRERMRAVDFLCGDFGWKERFRLLPRPLYELHVPSVERVPERMAREESCVRAE